MSSSALAAGLRHLRGRMAAQGRSQESDEQLLYAFTTGRDEDAFAVLVRRHGSMVLHVCRRVLEHQQDAEDAFQATFLVLARGAARLRRKTALASFLHGTAYRLAQSAKRAAARRRKHEAQAATRPPVDPADELSWHEVRTLLDEEIARLPEIYRSVFILSCLENMSRAEAAQRLGLKECTVSSRLAEARKWLAKRLAKRGVELTAVLAAAGLATQPASALSPVLMSTTIKAALATAAGEGLTGVVSASVVELVKSVTTALMLSKTKIATVVLLAASLLTGAGAWTYRGMVSRVFAAPVLAGEPPSKTQSENSPKTAPSSPRPTTAKQEIQGRVLDADGKPVSGAKLFVPRRTKSEPTLHSNALVDVVGTTDAEGRFRVTVHRPGPDARNYLLAHAAGFGVDWV
ncbi:MAG: sigma-70 family RNA polymerase sigma factor, partial [Gemmataceae bacterium]